MKNLNNYHLKDKNVLFRADLNVPLIDGKISDKSRIDAIKSSIKKLIKQNNKVFLISHIGRPKGKYDKKYSLNFLIESLIQELEVNQIHFLDNFDNLKIKNMMNLMKKGEVCLFENIRFNTGEESNDLNFAKEISNNFDAYVNDAFSASHREHASIVGIPNFLPSIAGINMLSEIKNINKFVDRSKKPSLAIIGGSKISTKISLLNNLSERCDFIVVAGAMANTFLYAKKIKVGNSLYEENLSKEALLILEKAKNHNCEIILPVDVVCANNLNDKNNIRECDIKNIPPNQMILDVGSKTVQLIKEYILKSSMILWNGPLGAFEYKPFQQSSFEVANIIKKHTKLLNITTIAGGGDTISVIKMAKAESGFSYISNAGGAFLEWLEGKESPGVLALKKNNLF